MEQFQRDTDRTEREYLVEDFVSNCLSPAVVAEFDRAMSEVLSRLGDEPFELITSEINPVVFNSFGASTADRLFIPCNGTLSSRPIENGGHWIPYIVIGGGFMQRSERGRVGEIAHEFAHAVLTHTKVEDHQYGGPKAEALADRLACQWGFQAEIDELNSDDNGPHG